MEGWRPDNWVNPYEELLRYETNLDNHRTAFEAGADAILEALREYGLMVRAGNTLAYESNNRFKVFGNLTKGVWVFSPDREVRNEKRQK